MSIDEMMERAQLGWLIDICATCGVEAKWPFCAHRQTNRPWTLLVTVKATPASRRAMLKTQISPPADEPDGDGRIGTA